MINVNSKILWLADYDLHEAPGGAQRSDAYLIQKGKILGFNIIKKTSTTFNSSINIDDYDVVITSNIHALLMKNPSLLESVSQHKHHVRLEHDSNEYLSQTERILLFSNCKTTIFLSDYHYEFFKSLYGDIFHNVKIVYDYIDNSIFKDYQQPREEKILFAGYMHPLKGAYEFFDYVLSQPEQKFAVAGWPSNNIINFLLTNVKNVEYLGLVDHEKMPLVYNKYKYMFYIPNLKEPFCRSVAESIVCGMKLITNKAESIGCLNEIQKHGIEKFASICSKADDEFWNSL